MPNKLQFCGPSTNNDLFEYGTQNIADNGLKNILKQFQTLYPYLKLISHSNNIKDLFNKNVVEAYWLGNEFLEKTTMDQLYWHFIDNLNLKKKLTHKDFESLTNTIPKGAFPYHNFHVINVFLRTGNLAIEHTLETMNKCKISWGQIIKIEKNELEIMTPNLIIENNKLMLSKPQIKKITYTMIGKSFLNKPQINDYITFHWDWACEIITKKQVENLLKYTNKAIKIVRESLEKV